MPNKIIDGLNHVLGKKGFDYDQINERIFIGTNMCCQFGFDKELLSQNVRADISLEKNKIDTPQGVDYFLWLPTADRAAISQDKLLLGVQTLEFLIARKIKTYVHCKNGHGRAPMLYVAYLIKTGLGVDEAITLLKSSRPTMHLNEAQMDALKKFKDSLKD